MWATVTDLRPVDRVRQDGEPIASMYRTMGTRAAQEVVGRALGELALTMAGLTDGVASGDTGGLPRQLRRLERMSEQLGLSSMTEVAGTVRTCVERQDMTAFAAVWARLVRVAEVSLASETRLLDRSR